jgi:propanol-preferring alcohol dehydrogenase
MKAMILRRLTDLARDPAPLEMADWPNPEPAEREIRLRVSACGVCHTELDEIEGRTPPIRLPMILGHQVVGVIDAVGPGATRFAVGQRVGVAWIYRVCGECEYCRSGRENLCPTFQATGRDAAGGYAELMTVHEDFAFAIPDGLGDAQAAPLLCAGAIGYRSLRLAGIEDGQPLGLTGFGASAHLVPQMVRHKFPRCLVYVFARSPAEQAFARQLGAVWAGGTTDAPPEKLDAIIDTTPAWLPIVAALKNLAAGGRLVINAIRKEARDQESLLRLDYARDLWLEREIKSVANVTRADVEEFLALAARMGLTPEIQEYPLAEANAALCELKQGKVRGAKVLRLGA